MINWTKKDNMLWIQTVGIEGYRRKYRIKPEDIGKVIKKYRLLKFLRENYELLHIQSDSEIIRDIEKHIRCINKHREKLKLKRKRYRR